MSILLVQCFLQPETYQPNVGRCSYKNLKCCYPDSNFTASREGSLLYLTFTTLCQVNMENRSAQKVMNVDVRQGTDFIPGLTTTSEVRWPQHCWALIINEHRINYQPTCTVLAGCKFALKHWIKIDDFDPWPSSNFFI